MKDAAFFRGSRTPGFLVALAVVAVCASGVSADTGVRMARRCFPSSQFPDSLTGDVSAHSGLRPFPDIFRRAVPAVPNVLSYRAPDAPVWNTDSMPLIRPDSSIDFKILRAGIDMNIEYKLQILQPRGK